MEHWADPWADDANDDGHTKTLPTPAVAPPEPPSPLPSKAPERASVVLSGFLDDAQWGSVGEEEDWGGGWSGESVRREEWGNVVETERARSPTPVEEEDGWGAHAAEDAPREEEQRHAIETERTTAATPVVEEEDGWGAPTGEDDAPKAENQEEAVSDHASEPDTTSHPDEEHASRSAIDAEDDTSIRSSTSPSDASHAEPPVESPRTSIEEDRIAGKVAQPEPEAEVDVETQEPRGRTSSELTVTEAKSEAEENPPDAPSEEQFEEFTESSAPSAAAADTDPSLLSQLFPLSKATKDLEAPPEDPVYSTSSRKTWYRLTRKETLREFNSGGSDNNYVRVNWANSQVRQQVGKIVSRWAAEDRMLGRGPGSRATFYWDQPLRLEEKFGGSHSRSSSTPHIAFKVPPPGLRNVSIGQKSQPASTDAAAAFNWSSELVGPAPWRSDEKSSVADRTEMGMGSDAHFASAQAQHTRSTSMHPVPPAPHKNEHQRKISLISPPQRADTSTPTSIDAALNTPPAPPPAPIPAPPASKPIPPPLDTSTPNAFEDDNNDEDDDDDDEWGEMVQSPTIPAPVDSFPPHPTPPLLIPPPPARNPSFASSSSSPFAAPGSKDASPIVRLQGTLVPNLGVANVSKYVPSSIEQGPIGPGILRKKSASSMTPERLRAGSVAPSGAWSGALLGESPSEVGTANGNGSAALVAPQCTQGREDSNKRFEEAGFAQAPSSGTEAAPTATTTASTDAWLNADLSIFDSAPAPPSLPPLPPPAPSTAPRNSSITSPISNTAMSTRDRKSADDETATSIVSNLPDLGYMLRP